MCIVVSQILCSEDQDRLMFMYPISLEYNVVIWAHPKSDY